MTASVDQVKVRSEHLARLAFVYVRQSSARQVRNNLESQRLQYGFAEQAVALGWTRDRITVLDEDQGRSAALPNARNGFGDMVATVARGEVGIVMSFELSRLSRNDLDWHQLVYLCRWTGTLIADEQGLYDPSSSGDRMVLGIRGQVSESSPRPCPMRHQPCNRRASGAARRELGRVIAQSRGSPRPSSPKGVVLVMGRASKMRTSFACAAHAPHGFREIVAISSGIGRWPSVIASSGRCRLQRSRSPRSSLACRP